VEVEEEEEEETMEGGVGSSGCREMCVGCVSDLLLLLLSTYGYPPPPPPLADIPLLPLHIDVPLHQA